MKLITVNLKDFVKKMQCICRNYYSTVRNLQDPCKIRPELESVGFVVPESDLLLRSLLLVRGLFPEGVVSPHLRR